MSIFKKTPKPHLSYSDKTNLLLAATRLIQIDQANNPSYYKNTTKEQLAETINIEYERLKLKLVTEKLLSE